VARNEAPSNDCPFELLYYYVVQDHVILVRLKERFAQKSRLVKTCGQWHLCHMAIKSSSQRLPGKVALVTGGASGIGRALCEALATDGAFVIIADINPSKAEQVVAGIRQRGGKAEAVSLDVADEVAVNKVVDDIVAAHAHLDFTFNNAAVATVGELRDGNTTDFRRVVEVNLLGVMYGTVAAYRVMLRQGFGHIVNLSSMAGLMATPLLTAYSATKWGIVGFSSALRAEAAGLGVKVSVVCPGLIRTEMGEHNMYWNVRKEDYLAQLPWRWMMPPDKAAKYILRGVERNQELILFPLSNRVGWWAHRAFPQALAPLMRSTLRRFRALRIKP
jgi:NAD(P)-dependent dehydrogenase (short-subunit alcohol dehydrogenase family)